MILPTTPMKAASPGHADRQNGWFGYAGHLTGLLMVALVAGQGTGLADPPSPTQLPTGEQVVGGAATISRQQATMTINQSTSRAAIDWQTFDIGSQAHVNIRQPSTDSVLFNRIQGNNPSQIFGGLTANGQVYLSNPSGFYFAPSASVNVGGLVATTHQLSLDEFMAGRDRFSRNGSTGHILNEGHLKAALGGYIALLAPEVRNRGVLMAELGTVALAAGEAYELRFDPARRLEGLRVEPAQIRTLVENKQAVLAPGGLIVLSAQGASQLQGSVVRHDGTLEASSLVSKGGRIMLEGDAITLGARSTTTASGATGGGEVLVGGGWQGSGPLKHATSTTVETGATIDVSATQRGDGGTAVLWSDVRNPIGRTQVSGSILASGGAQSGNGGRIETSGHTLQVEDSTRISTLAPHGRVGEWLLDPVDFTIVSGSGAQTTSSIGATTLGTALNSSNVTIATDASILGNGDITVAANVTKTASSGTTTLTLKSHRSVVMNNGISINGAAGAPLNVVFWADSDNSGGGGVQLRNVTTQGGHLYLGGGTASTTWNGLTVPNGPTKSFGGLPPTHFTGTLSTAGGDLYLWNGPGASAAGQFTTAGGAGVDVFNAGAGNITLRVDAVNIPNNLTITTTGMFSLLPSTSGGSFRDPVLTSQYILTGAQGGLTIGTSGNTANITHQTNAYSTNGPIQLHGGTVTLNAGLTTTNASTGDVSITASTGLTGSSGITLANGRTLTVTQSGNTTYNGVISGSGAGLTKLGIGDLSLGGASTYTGATTVNAGVLSLAAADRIPDASRLVVGANGTFSLNGFDETVGGIEGSGLIVNGAVVRDGLVLWLDAGNTSSYNGTGNTWYDLSGNGYHGTIYGSPTYSSANSLFTFANNSQYVRLTTLPANFLGSTVTGMTIFSVANFGATADNWERVVDLGNAGAGGITPNHNIILSRYGTDSRLNFETYNGVIGGNENKTGTNSAITNGKASYAGTADGSNLMIYKDGTLNTTTASTALPAAIARNDNFIGKSNWTADDTFRGDIGTVMVYNRALSATEIAKNHQLLFNRSTATLTVGGDNTHTTFSGTIENGVGTLNMVKQGTGTLTLTGANSYSGASTVSDGTLAVGNGGSTGTLGSGVVTSNAALVFNRSGNVALSAMASHAGDIGGTGSVSATASGDLTIDRSISVGGPVTLTASNGNVAINSAVSTPASTITLSAGGSGGTVTQGVSGSLSVTNLALLGGNVTLEHSANAISTLAASGVTTLTYADSNALTIGTVGATTGINATGPVRIETLSGDLTVAQNIATTNTGASALILNAGKATAAGTMTGGNLLISGAPTLTIGSGGRATLYSGSISSSTGLTSLVGSGSGRFRYNSDESTTNYTLALGSGLHGIYRENPTVSVAVENKTITYGNALPTWTYTTSGMVNGDQVAQAFASPSVSVGGATSTSGSYTAGNHTLTASGMTSSQLGYAVGTLTTGTMTVNTKAATLSGLTAADKVYDGTTAATVAHSGASFTGLVAGDTVTASGTTGSFSTKQVGTGKTVTLSATTYGGADAANYTFTDQASTTATITPKAATLSGLTAADKVYDGTTAATVAHSAASFTGLVAGDTVTASGTTGTFASKQVGTGKTVTLSATTYGGADAANYTFTDQASTTATITPKAATLSGLTAADKVYDGTTNATVAHSGASFTGLVAGDTVTASGTTGSFSTKQVGTGKTVTLSATTYGGADAANYTFTDQASTTAAITPKALVIDLHGQGSRAYDGTTTILLNSVTPSLTGLVGGDTVNVATGNVTGFVEKNAGTNKAVTYSGFGLSGTDAGNYVLSTGSASSTASITPKAVTLSGLMAADKAYDGTTTATVAHSGASFSGLVAGDTVTASGTIGTFADALVGIAKPVTLTGTVYGGADAGNYAFTPQTVTSASILARNTSSQFQQYLGGITQFSHNYKPVPGSSSTLPPQSPLLVTGTHGSTGGAGTAGLATLFPIDGIIVNWIREHSVDGTHIVTVSIPQSIIARGDMISFELPEDLITALTTTPNQFAQTNGNPLPVWLEYNETRGQFRITEPATISSLPYEVVANLEQSRVLVRINTR